VNPRVSRETRDERELVRGRAIELGLSLDTAQVDRLLAYRRWLGSEGIAGGAVGPNEGEEILGRHVLEGLGFVAGFEAEPWELLDVGSGGGIPGIPLAIVWPGCRVTLLDRSGRKVALLRRAVRVAGIENVEVQEGEAERCEAGRQAVVMRAVFPPGLAVSVLDRLLVAEGTGVAAVASDAAVPPAPPGRRLQVRASDSEILARRLHLLIMAPL
jgi:16S rRNA (guanine527-N7)-methyltransferase